MQNPKEIVVFFHNLENFDGHEIIQAIVRLRNNIVDANPEGEMGDEDASECPDLSTFKLTKLRFGIVANTTEKYMQITLGPVVFRDTFKFASTSLAKLIESQRKVAPTLAECFPMLTAHHPFLARSAGVEGVEGVNQESLDLMLQKVPMAYKLIVDKRYFQLPAILPQECYDNDLTDEPCSEKEYATVHEVVEHFKFTDQGEYHDLYLYTDVLTLADCLETMRKGWREHCGLHLLGLITLPSAS